MSRPVFEVGFVLRASPKKTAELGVGGGDSGVSLPMYAQISPSRMLVGEVISISGRFLGREVAMPVQSKIPSWTMIPAIRFVRRETRVSVNPREAASVPPSREP